MAESRLLAMLLTTIELDSARSAQRPAIVIVTTRTDFLPAAMALKMNGSAITIATRNPQDEPHIRKLGLSVIRLAADHTGEPQAAARTPPAAPQGASAQAASGTASAVQHSGERVLAPLPAPLSSAGRLSACKRLANALQRCTRHVFADLRFSETEARCQVDANTGTEVAAKVALLRGLRGRLDWNRVQLQAVLTVLLVMDELGGSFVWPRQLSCELSMSLQVRFTGAHRC